MTMFRNRRPRDQNDDRPHVGDDESADAGSIDDGAPAFELGEEAQALIARLESERDEAIAARQRALADYANFQRRSRENELRMREDGKLAVMRSLLPVADHFDLALAQPAGGLTVEQLLDGVKIVHAELAKVMESHGVTPVTPEPGDEFDPRRHEAVMRQPAPNVKPGHVSAVLQGGYALGDLILRPAKVAVAPDDAAG